MNTEDHFDHIASHIESPIIEKGGLFQMYKAGKIDCNIPSSQEQRPITYKTVSISPPNEFPENAASTSLNTAPIISSNLIVNHRQKGNGVIDCLRSVRWAFGEIEPDFIMSRTSCALFLSLSYHKVKPSYIFTRIKGIGSLYELRVLLVLVDVVDSTQEIRELSQLCISNNLTLLLAWSNDEAARYLESFKMFENKPPDILTGEKIKSEKLSAAEEEINKYVSFLTSIASINKTDARKLMETFGTIEAIMLSDFEQLRSCPGLGALKARNLYDLFRKPIRKHESQ